MHVNAEFADQASDHDPQVARLGTGPDFALSVPSLQLVVRRGTTVNVAVGINRTGGFTGGVTVTAPGAAGLRIKVKPPSRNTTAGSAAFKLKIRGNAPVGTQGSCSPEEMGRAASGRPH